MPYTNMSLDEFARHVGMDLRDVEKLAERGKLPGERVAGRWRFNRAAVTEWLQQAMPSLTDARLIDIERAMAGDPAAADAMFVTGLMPLAGIEMNVRAASRASILRELLALAERTDLLYDKEGFFDAIAAREEMCSTAMPNGVAIPHARQPMPYVSAEPFICLGRVPQGLAFGSPDGVLTHLFFLIASHDDRQHLHVLARLVRMLDRPTVEGLRDVDDADAALALLIRREEALTSRKR